MSLAIVRKTYIAKYDLWSELKKDGLECTYSDNEVLVWATSRRQKYIRMNFLRNKYHTHEKFDTALQSSSCLSMRFFR